MPNRIQIKDRLLGVARAVSRDIGLRRAVPAVRDNEYDQAYEGSYAVVGTIQTFPVLLYAGKYFRDTKRQRSVQFWSGLEVPARRKKALLEYLIQLADQSFEAIGLDAYTDEANLWLPSEQSHRWYRSHLDMSDGRYIWFGRFFNPNQDDALLARIISRYLKSGIEVERTEPKRTRPKKKTATEKKRFTKYRIGQDIFRENLLGAWNSQCRVSGVGVPELLRASHLKPWAACTSDDEKGDPENGLLLSANLDALFDRGLISFDSSGRIQLSDRLSKSLQRDLGISSLSKLKGKPSARQAKYLKWHREYWKL